MAFLRLNYNSTLLGYQTNVNMILPFERKMIREGVIDVSERYPVLYLLHGGGGNQDDWVRYTSIERYAEKYQIAVVMPDVGGNSFYADMKYGYPYFQYLTTELPEWAESYFPIGGKREKRFVAGLSMGGYGSLKWGLNRPEFFCYAADFSGASLITHLFSETGFAGGGERGANSTLVRNWGSMEELEGSGSDTRYLLEQAAKHKEQLPGLYVCIGTEDFSYEYTKEFMEYAGKLGLDIEYEEGPGEHNWDFWDTYILRYIEKYAGAYPEELIR
ncbi:MAG: esterase family protein [Lachnospiraceae bacterium]|nr:esterase family protein [Lachnospiraceae bacterium]